MYPSCNIQPPNPMPRKTMFSPFSFTILVPETFKCWPFVTETTAAISMEKTNFFIGQLFNDDGIDGMGENSGWRRLSFHPHFECDLFVGSIHYDQCNGAIGILKCSCLQFVAVGRTDDALCTRLNEFGKMADVIICIGVYQLAVLCIGMYGRKTKIVCMVRATCFVQ